MSPAVHQFISIDLPPILTALFASIACGLLGNYLVLRRMSLMGDAISHAVLPGLVAAFLITGGRGPVGMFIGAAAAGMLTVIVVALIRRLGRLESGAAMGVTFSIFFALGVLLLEQAAARQVDLDPDCVLHGMLETIFWFPPADWAALLTTATLAELPRQVTTTGLMLVAAILFILIFFKELRLSSFDAGLSTALGFNAAWLSAMLMVMVAASTVAAFEAVGSILVIAMLICPAATARLLTDRLRTQILLSALIASATTITGYILGAFAPIWLGHHSALSTTGMMTVTAGVLLALTIIASPSRGMIIARIRRARLAAQVAREDILGVAFRLEEAGHPAPVPIIELLRMPGSARSARLGLREAIRRGELVRNAESVSLTDPGRRVAAGLVRSHRLWESYLVEKAGLRPDHVHDTAMKLEHITDTAVRRELSHGRSDTASDPQGKAIPEEPRSK